MTTYSVTGPSYDSSSLPGFIIGSLVNNPVTGQMGVTDIKISNIDSANAATVSYTPGETTYTYENVNYTTTSSGTGATFTVTVGVGRYYATAIHSGFGYSDLDTFTVPGDIVGGVTPDNDVIIQAMLVGPQGEIRLVQAAGIPQWPQGPQPTVTIAPGTETFVQLPTNKGLTLDGTAIADFFITGTGGFNVTPVQVLD